MYFAVNIQDSNIQNKKERERHALNKFVFNVSHFHI